MKEMTENTIVHDFRFREKLLLGMSFRDYLKSNLTFFNAVAAVILSVGVPVMAYRILYGIGPATNLSDTNPWGLWIGFDVMTGVALSAGGFVLGTAVHLFGMKEYGIFVRPAILTGFLGYLYAVMGLIFDLGRYYRLPYPMAVSFGVNSILFLVAWHVALYLTCQFIELCPAIFEWLEMAWLRRVAVWVTLGATVAGVILSTLHQSALGSLFLLMPSKVHPLWYSSLIPVLFFVSAIIAGISMVIVESALSHLFFRKQVQRNGIGKADFDRLTIGLGKAAALTLITYFGLKLLAVAHDHNWHWLLTRYGAWWMFEVIGFVLLPAALFAVGVRHHNARIVRGTAVIAILGIALNRLNLSVIAFNWNLAEQYFPHWMEYTITITLITMFLLEFRWIVNRLPILHAHPKFPSSQDH
jgi:Ni/Fe-hydrogenase subunit HybB-like protein